METPVIAERKQRITKKQSQEFSRWYASTPEVQQLSITNIIERYYQLTNVRVSRMFVSNVRSALNASTTA